MIYLTKKKIVNALLAIFLMLFSFYYTDKSIDLIRQSDPIMRQIKSSSSKYKVEAVDAKVEGNTITPGVVGIDVDYDASYKKMKNYGTYNESLTVFKEIKPTISVDDYYDKYISSGNGINHDVALVFPVTRDSNISSIVNTLNEKGVTATFFLDGLWYENNLNYVSTLTPFELELLSYDNRYDEIYFSSSINSLASLTSRSLKFCYAEYDNKEVLELCSKLGLHTIIPTVKVGNYPYSEIKKRLRSSDIISLPVNSTTEVELSVVIDYIKQKGYNFVTLEDLLSESTEK